MYRQRPLEGGCSCGRNRYIIRIPQDTTEVPRVFFDSSHAHRKCLQLLNQQPKKLTSAKVAHKPPLSPPGSASHFPGINRQLNLISPTKHAPLSADLIPHLMNKMPNVTSVVSAARHFLTGPNNPPARHHTSALRLAHYPVMI
jgi:hypothetical protein